ncbi:MAG: hypothetical protein HYW27_03020 [Candidatus Aenigmarchaeota archaeon]|nr:hypothetical protein [Candidatus Aenigmarchaeota archaeon]
MPAYKVGISSGFWNIAKDPNLLGLAQKAGGFGATGGIQFNQVDMETISEFQEPRLKENMKKVVKDLGIEVGLHGEIGEMSGFESAQRKIWEQVHLRLVQTLKNAAELGFIYVNYHLSTNLQVQQEEDRLKFFGHQYQMVAPDGKPLASYVRANKAAKEFAVRQLIEMRTSVDEELSSEYWRKEMEKAEREAAQEFENYKKSDDFRNWKEGIENRVKSGITTREQADAETRRYLESVRRQITDNRREAVNRRIRTEDMPGDIIFDMWERSPFGKYYIRYGEIGAYWLIGKFMIETNDPLWKGVVKTDVVQEAYNAHVKEFNEALSMKYIEGHLTLNDHPFNRKFRTRRGTSGNTSSFSTWASRSPTSGPLIYRYLWARRPRKSCTNGYTTCARRASSQAT